MSTIKKTITKSNSHKMKTKTKQFHLTSVEKTWDLSPLWLVNQSTKKEQIGVQVQKKSKFKKNYFDFWKQLISLLFMSLDINRNHWNVHLYLLRKKFRHVINQCSIVQNFEANCINDYCYNLKRNQRAFEMYKYMKTYHSVQFRCNSGSKAEKQMFKAKFVVQIKLQLTGNGLWPVFTETEPQIDRKTL